MPKSIYLFCLTFCFITASAFAQEEQIQWTPISADLEIYELEPNLWLHRSYNIIGNNYRASSNGLLVAGEKRSFLVDTPWGEDVTEDLLNWADSALHKPIVRAVVTHFHDDRMGGITPLQNRKVIVYGCDSTIARAKAEGLPLPDSGFAEVTQFNFDGVEIEAFYPGRGHTPDNIVVWFPQKKLLAGGCMVKARSFRNLGFVGDAIVAEWKTSLENIKARYPNDMRVIPGHSENGGVEFIDYTIEMIEAYLAKRKQE